VGEHALEMAARAEQIAQVMLRRTHQLLADHTSVRLGPLRRQSMEPLREGQSDALPAGGDVEGPQGPKRAQLVLDVTEALRNLEGLCPAAPTSETAPLVYISECASAAWSCISRCGSRLAPAAIAARACSTGRCTPPSVTNAPTWAPRQQSAPRRSRRHRDEKASRAPRGRCRSSGRSLPAIGGWPRLRLRLSTFKNIQIPSGMASRHRVELAGLNELLERIGRVVSSSR